MQLLKKGSGWTACFDKNHNRYVAELYNTDREGCTRNLFEITQDIFARLGTFADNYENEKLMKTGRELYYFENTMYGTQGPHKVVFDDNYKQIWDDAYECATGGKSGKKGKKK